MKKLILTVLTPFLMLLASNILAAELVVEGTYQGKNIFVQNPFSGNAGFCITEVLINGKVSTDEIQQSSFELDLGALQLVVGQKVVIKIKYKDGCKPPKVVNPEDLKPRSTFEIVAGSMKVSKDGKKLSWTSKGETGKLTFVVEHYRWNKWVKVAEVEGKGTPDPTYYEVNYVPFSGENRIRVKQTDSYGPRLSEPIKYRSMSPAITMTQDAKSGNVNFSGETKYEVFDSYGNVVLQGFSNNVDISSLKKGTYYINFDNKSGDKITRK
jgi:hypothetical protein